MFTMNSNDILQMSFSKVTKHLHNLAELGPLGLPCQAWPAHGVSQAPQESNDIGLCPLGAPNFIHIS